MLTAFKSYIAEHNLFDSQDHILLAVSGGIDSVVMAHLFADSGYSCSVAHCNFQLRGSEAEADESFVSSLAALLDVPVYTKRFNTDDYAVDHGISIQMAARKLRYEWFNELVGLHNFDRLATAHNMNDSVETIFINLSRGTGIRGLTGIPLRNEKIIRPLLFATRKEIIQYAKDHQINYREDSTNRETKYRRNKIRHDVIPIMEQINPGFMETMTGNISRIGETYAIFQDAVDHTRNQLFQENRERIRIPLNKLRELQPLRIWLFELFSPFGFTRLQCEEIGKIMGAESGRRSISPTHQLFKDREHLILVKSEPEQFDRYYLDSPDKHSSLPFPMDVELLDRSDLEEIPKNSQIACLDYDLIQFPLTIRHWQHGDYFSPLGMDQMKKLSDFFVDEKIPVPLKKRIWILASGKKIVWIMGYRIDNHFRITESTTHVLILRFETDISPQHSKELL